MDGARSLLVKTGEMLWGLFVLLIAAGLSYGATFLIGLAMTGASGSLSALLRYAPTGQSDIEDAFLIVQKIFVDGSTFVVLTALALAVGWLLICIFGPQPAVPGDLRRRRARWWIPFLFCFIVLFVAGLFAFARVGGIVLSFVPYFLALITAAISGGLVLWLGMGVALPLNLSFIVPVPRIRVASRGADHG